MSETKNKHANPLNHLQNIIALKDLMMNSDIKVAYLGRVTQATIDGFSSITQEELSDKHESKVVSKRVYHVMIEALQNICKHADSTTESSSDSLEQGLAKEGIFLIGDNETEYFVTTGNQISMQNAINLRGILDRVNALDKDELKALYRTVMETTGISEKGGAGLGFIDMKKKTGTEFEYYLEPLDEHSCFFILTIRIEKAAASAL